MFRIYDHHNDSGAEAINMKSTPDWYTPSTLSFFALDDVGCKGSESNLLDCLPQHNCKIDDRGTENGGVQCLRKGMDDQIYNNIIATNKIILHYGLF